MSKEIIERQHVESVRDKLKASFSEQGTVFKSMLDCEIQLMKNWRRYKKAEIIGLFPDNPDEHEEKHLIYNQLACEIYQGEITLAENTWETHEAIRARQEIPENVFRISGELFYLRNLPKVPIIRLDAALSDKEIQILNKTCVLLDPYYQVL